MKPVAPLMTLALALLAAATPSAQAGKNAEANPVSNQRAKAAARAEGVMTGQKVSEPRKGGYHVGSDTRYQPSKRDASVTKKWGGKGPDGRYRHEDKR